MKPPVRYATSPNPGRYPRLLLLTTWLALPAVVQAGDYLFTNLDGAVIITGYTGSVAEVTIPNLLQGRPVTIIGDFTFSRCSSLTSITLPNSVTRIGEGAFQGCANLTNITLGNKVASIGPRAFSACASLTGIRIPNSVTNIGEDALRSCTSLTNVTLGRGVTNLGHRFFGCRSLTTITVEALNPVYSSIDGVLFNKQQTTLIQCPEGKAGTCTVPEGVIRIGVDAFADCRSLTNILIPDSVTTLAGDAFSGCNSLASITLGHGITGIGRNAFRGCTRLSDVTLGGSITNIGDYAFGDCTSLTLIAIPNSVTRIGAGAFYWCTGLTTMTVPGSVTTIGRDAFRGCGRLPNITLGSGVTNLGNRFSACRSLTRITVDALNPVYSGVDGVLFNKDQTTLIQFPEGKTGSYTMPKTVTVLGDHAFADCAGVTNITLCANVTRIGAQAFASCTGLTDLALPDAATSLGEDALRGCRTLTAVSIGSGLTNIGGRLAACPSLSRIAVDARNTAYSSVDGVLFSKDRTTLIQCPEGITGSYTVPGSVTRLGDNAFADCTGLTNITIPDSAAIIGSRAFCYCAQLDRLALPDSVTSVGEDAFRGCRALADLSIGSSVTNMPRRFSGCLNLKRITVDARNPVYCSVDGVLFNKRQTTLIQCPEGKVGSYTIPASVTRLGENAFADCTSLSNINISGSVTSIGTRAFSWCTGLTGITIPPNVTRIEYRAFESCGRLTAVYCKGNAPVLGADVFNSDYKAAVYYLPGTKGWGPTFGGRSAALWNGPEPAHSQAPPGSADSSQDIRYRQFLAFEPLYGGD
jgi:hypothetical protein